MGHCMYTMKLRYGKRLELGPEEPRTGRCLTYCCSLDEAPLVDEEGGGAHHCRVLALPGAARHCAAVGRTRDGERFSRAERLEHWVQMLLGIFSARGVLPVEFKPAYSMGYLLTQRLGELEQEAESKGAVLQALSDHFAKVYKTDLAAALAA